MPIVPIQEPRSTGQLRALPRYIRIEPPGVGPRHGVVFTLRSSAPQRFRRGQATIGKPPIWPQLHSPVWPKLKILEISSDTLPTEALHDLFESNDLRELHLHGSDATPFVPPTNKCLSTLRVLSISHFSDLSRHIHAEDDDPDEVNESNSGLASRIAERITAILGSISSPDLEEIGINTTYVTSNALRTIATALSEHAKLRKIVVKVGCVSDGLTLPLPMVDFEDLSPLYAPLHGLSELRSLEIVGPPVDVRSPHIAKLGRAWPELRRLSLSPKRVVMPANLSILDLRLFAQHCPNLREVAVRFNPSDCPCTAPKDLKRHPRQCIVVDASCAIVHGVKEIWFIFSFLRALFPECMMRDFPSIPDRWYADDYLHVWKANYGPSEHAILAWSDGDG